jgi:arabinose-5-phosphate isomerase
VYETQAQLMRRFIEVEALAVTRAARCLDEGAASRAIALLHPLRGKVVTLGVGKSGLVASKIAATFASFGTPATFLHASDALHGDIGGVVDADVAVVVSNSGETEELLVILPFLRERGVRIIAIVGNVSSTLARVSEVVLDASVANEACPLGLTPTASTTVALALGDAMAMTVMAARGVTAADFAHNHPAGRLGKRLTLRVRDIMHGGSKNPIIEPEASWFSVLERITKGGLGAVSVVASDGMLLGLVTDGDLRRMLGQHPQNPERFTARELMTAKPVVVAPDTLAYDALRTMEQRPSQISVLPVVEGERCVGMLRLHDIVRSGL